jgi:D-alanyl-D-alanine carboxypeptidase
MEWGNRCGRSRVVAFWAAVASVLAALAGPAAMASGRSRPRAAALTAAIERVMRQASIPGAIVGVWQRGSAPYVKAFGVRNTATRKPMGTKLYMRIGSETKTFVGTALLQLVDRGKVALDSPISSYLAGVPHGNTITIRELADMRSGLFNYTNNPAFARAWFAAPRRAWMPQQLLGYGFSKPVMFAPGTGYDYSNTNTVLLGLVVEKVSHEPIAVYIKRHILRPDRLMHTRFPTGAEFPSLTRRATPTTPSNVSCRVAALAARSSMPRTGAPPGAGRPRR